MKITKLGHCCLVIEVKGIRILTDPGAWTSSQNEQKNIDLILITHEHPDHLHVESLKTVLQNNPGAEVITNNAVSSILKKEGINSKIVVNGEIETFKDVTIEGFGEKHADIYPGITPVENTGYLIDGALFDPGDAFTVPDKKVEILALPVCGPWMHMREALDYAKAIKPVTAFPIHDGMLKIMGPFHMLPEMFLKPEGINFVVLELDREKEF